MKLFLIKHRDNFTFYLYQNGVLRRTFGHGDHIKEDEMVGHVACIEEMIDVYKILAGKPQGKRKLRTPRRVCEGNAVWIL
jgi:hypothetical protein